jgi:hypothetical protein
MGMLDFPELQCAGVTQLVEYLLPKQVVVGSSPITRSLINRRDMPDSRPGCLPRPRHFGDLFTVCSREDFVEWTIDR